jgi:hypothetical protein
LRVEIEQKSNILGAALQEVQWRLFNAEVMEKLNLKKDLEYGIEAAKKAIELAPHALDVKANLGSLYLLLAAQHAVNNLSPIQDPTFIESEIIFNSLLETGWDPGFVKYRLGTIRRVQGKYPEAIVLLDGAADPSIIDVNLEYIEAQKEKSKKGDNTLSLNDL